MKYVTLIFAILISLACTNRSHKNTINNEGSAREEPVSINHEDFEYDTIEVDLNKKYSPIELSDYYDVEFIMLEDKRKSKIGIISRVILTTDYIFVLDGTVAQKLFQFDRKGKYVRSIGSHGRGPGEYSEIADFDVSKSDREVYLYADDDQKIIIYDFEGELKKETRISSFGYAFNKFSDGSFLTIGWGAKYKVHFWDNNGKEVAYIKGEDNKFFNCQGLKIISKQNDDCFVHFPYNNFIYKAHDNNLKPVYYIDFKEKNFPPLNEIKSDEEFDKIDNSKDFAELGPIVNTKNMLCFHTYDGKKIRSCYFFKQKQELQITTYAHVKGVPVFEFIGEIDNGIILNGDPYLACSYFDDLKRLEGKDSRPLGLENLSIDSNPFIVVLSPKADSYW